MGTVASMDETVLQRFADILDLLAGMVLHGITRKVSNFERPLVLSLPPIVL